MKKSSPRCSNTPSYQLLEPRNLLTMFLVNTVGDSTAVDGLVSLREAVEAANSDTAVGDAPAGSGFDAIRFDASLDGKAIKLTLGECFETNRATQDGGAIFNKQGFLRVFDSTFKNNP